MEDASRLPAHAVSILTHERWADILPYLYVQHGEGLNGPRHRIEATDGARRWLSLWVNCVGCGRRHHPMKRREQWGTVYFSVTCAVGDQRSMRCRNGAAARTEADAIRAAIDGERTTPNLFT